MSPLLSSQILLKHAGLIHALGMLSPYIRAATEVLEWVCRKETLTGLLIRSVRYGGGAEACLAARCLGLLSITLGAGDDSERCRLSAHFLD